MTSPLGERKGFKDLRVVAFESRRAEAMEQLIQNHGGIPLVAPSMREIPMEENKEAFEFARELFGGRIEMVIFLTGVGTRFLTSLIETQYPREQWIAALSRVTVVARGPKPTAALKELGVPIAVTVPEPNTWRELLAALDQRRDSIPLAGRRVAVQEYGAPNEELIGGLETRGAAVRRVVVYRWALPEDTGPLRSAIKAIADGNIDLVLFTTSVQVVHMMQLASEMSLESGVRKSLEKTIVASIGPTTSEMLREYGLHADLEPSHPRMGILVKEAAERSRELLAGKRKT